MPFFLTDQAGGGQRASVDPESPVGGSGMSTGRPWFWLNRPARIAAWAVGCLLVLELLFRLASWLAFGVLNLGDRTTGNSVVNRLAFAMRWEDGFEEFGEGLYVPDPRRGYRLAPGFTSPNPASPGLTTNSRGMRATAELQSEPAEGVTRVVVIGDSFTFGVGVADQETWPSVLAATLPDVEVANLAAPGYGHDQILLSLEDEGLQLKPAVVVFGFFDGGTYRGTLDFFAYAKPKLNVETGNFDNIPIPTPDEIASDTLYYPRLLLVLEAIAEGFSRPEPYRVTDVLLRDMVAATSAAEAEFVVVPMVGVQDMARYISGKDDSNNYINRFCEENHVLLCNPLGALAKECRHAANPNGIDCLLDQSGHYNANGNRVVGKAVADCLSRMQPFM